MIHRLLARHPAIQETLQYWVTAALCLAVALYAILAHPVRVVGDSMYPTLRDGEIYASTVQFDREDIIRGGIVVVRDGKKQAVKRVAALPGDDIVIRDGKVFINGEPEPFSLCSTDDPGVFDRIYRLKADEYVVLGDNRGNSRDSRIYGPVHYDDIRRIVTVPPEKIFDVYR